MSKPKFCRICQKEIPYKNLEIIDLAELWMELNQAQFDSEGGNN